MNLSSLVSVYISERDNCRDYNRQLRFRVQHFCNFVGRDDVRAVDETQVNRWLTWLREREELAPSTARGYRASLLAVIGYAAELGIREPLNHRRIKKIRSPRMIPEAWSIEQIRQLLECAQHERNPLYWVLCVRVGFETGLRRSDVLRLDSVSERPWPVTESKTGYPRLVRVTAETVDLWAQWGDTLCWNRRRRAWFDTFRQIVRRARLRGTYKWLRRSHETHCGLGSLGHRDPSVSIRYYYDPTHSANVRIPQW